MVTRKKRTANNPHQMTEELLEAVAGRFRALSVPSRLRVLNALMAGPLSMAELEQATGLEQSNLSRQVTELERNKCVARSRNGRSVVVEIADPTLMELCDLMCGAVVEQAEKASAALRGA